MTWIVIRRPKSGLQGAKRPLVAATQPFEHPTEADARLEAQRLARENPANDFYVFGATSVQSAVVHLEETVIR